MQETSTFHVSEYWRFFLRLLHSRRWTILTFLTVTFLVVVIGTSLQTPVYEASATVLIDMELPSVLTVSTSRDDTTLGQSNYFTYADYYRTQLEVIKSRRVSQKVYEHLKLYRFDRYAKQKDPVGFLLNQLSVDPVKQTRLVKIKIQDRDPRLAARIANEFAFVFVSENLTRSAANEALTLMKNEYLKLQSKEAELSKRYKAKFPAMARLRVQMDQLSGAIEKELAHQLGDEQTASVTPEEPEAEKAAPDEEHTTTAGSVLKELQGSSILGGLRPNNIRVQDMAQVPSKKIKPKVLLNLMLGLLLGILGGVGAAMVEELLDGTLKNPKDLERDKRFVFLGHIPKINVPAQTGQTQPPPDAGALCKHMHLKPHSESSEGYRVIRTNLIYTAPEQETRTILFTSPGSGEGKTTTVSNLAIAFTQLGLKVLLVDTDLRKPSLHAGFGVPQTPGLSEFLAGRSSFQEIVHRTGIGELSVVTSGTCPTNPAELLALPKMQEFVKLAEQKFDRVFLDAPPAIPVTDPVILAALVKAVVAVAHCGKTPWQAMERLQASCSGVRAKILGVILNNVTGFDIPSYGYGHYNYPYGGKKPSSEPKDDTPFTFLKSAKNLAGGLKNQVLKNRPAASPGGGKVA